MTKMGEIRKDGRICFIQTNGFENWLTEEAYRTVSEMAYRAAHFAVSNGEKLHPGIAELFKVVGESADILSVEEKIRVSYFQSIKSMSLEQSIMAVLNERA